MSMRRIDIVIETLHGWIKASIEGGITRARSIPRSRARRKNGKFVAFSFLPTK